MNVGRYEEAYNRFFAASRQTHELGFKNKSKEFNEAQARRIFEDYWLSLNTLYHCTIRPKATAEESELGKLYAAERRLDEEIQNKIDTINSYSHSAKGLKQIAAKHVSLEEECAPNDIPMARLPLELSMRISEDYRRDLATLRHNTEERMRSIHIYPMPEAPPLIVTDVVQQVEEQPRYIHYALKLIYEQRTHKIQQLKNDRSVTLFLNTLGHIWPVAKHILAAYHWIRTGERNNEMIKALLNSMRKAKNALTQAVIESVELLEQRLEKEAATLGEQLKLRDKIINIDKQLTPRKTSLIQENTICTSPRSILHDNKIRERLVQYKGRKETERCFDEITHQLDTDIARGKAQAALPEIRERVMRRNEQLGRKRVEKERAYLMKQLNLQKKILHSSKEADEMRPIVEADEERLTRIPQHMQEKEGTSEFYIGLLDSQVLVPSFRIAVLLKESGVYNSDYAQSTLNGIRKQEQSFRPTPKDSVQTILK